MTTDSALLIKYSLVLGVVLTIAYVAHCRRFPWRTCWRCGGSGWIYSRSTLPLLRRACRRCWWCRWSGGPRAQRWVARWFHWE